MTADRTAGAGYKNSSHLSIPRQHARVVIRLVPTDHWPDMHQLHACQIVDFPGDVLCRPHPDPRHRLEHLVQRLNVSARHDEDGATEPPTRRVVVDISLRPAAGDSQIVLADTAEEVGNGVAVEAGQRHAAVVHPDEGVSFLVLIGGTLQPLQLLVLDGMVLHAILLRIVALGVIDRMTLPSEILDERSHPELWNLIVEHSRRAVAECAAECLTELCVFGRTAWVVVDGHIARHDPYLGSL